MALPDTVFALANGLALPAWIALAVSPPRARWTRWTWLVTGRLLPLAFALVYVAMLVASPPSNGGGFGSIAEVRALFAIDHALTAGWIHYLAFDLFVGIWIARQADSIGLSRLVQAPILLATFMFGPLGLLLFQGCRTGSRLAAPATHRSA